MFFLVLKVSFFNEIHEYCQFKNLNFEKVRSIATKDSRIGPGHSLVPGIDGKMGFGELVS